MQTVYAPVQGNARAKKNGNEWVGKWGEVWGTFGIALEMSLRKIYNEKKEKKHEDDESPFSWGLFGHRKQFLDLLV